MTRRANRPDPLVQPFVKWAGGKRQLLPILRPIIPSYTGRYFEPCLGGGAVLFALQPARAVVNDTNAEIINCYSVIKDLPEDLIAIANGHENTAEHFYQVRDWDRSPKFALLSPVERAARIIYLNKTCYNGLFRVNSQGQFNTPFGNYRNPVIADPAIVRAVSRYLNASSITLRIGDFTDAVAEARQGDFAYFDPPYDPLSDTSSFTGYSLNGFGRDDQRRLKDVCDMLTGRNVKLLLSNSDTPFVRELYASGRYFIHEVQARRSVNSVGDGRGVVSELLICNYAS